MQRCLVVGVMGGGPASAESTAKAYRLGQAIAKEGWILLNGGRNAGIMEASAKGAFEQGGMTIGVVPDDHDRQVSKYIKIPILTGMGHARNCINVLSSNVVVACPGGAGTVSEIALALKNRRPVILFNFFIEKLFDVYLDQGILHHADRPQEVIKTIKKLFPDLSL